MSTEPIGTDDEVIAATLRAMDAWISGPAWAHGPRCCIVATRAVVAVLRAHDIEATPLAVDLAVSQGGGMVAGAGRFQDADVRDGYGQPVRPRETVDGWPGHLVCVTPGRIVDASHGQFGGGGGRLFEGELRAGLWAIWPGPRTILIRPTPTNLGWVMEYGAIPESFCDEALDRVLRVTAG